MKKIIAILLIFIYCFNLFGYIIVFDFLQQSASTQIVSALDKGTYEPAELVEVKVAYTLPYSVNGKEYERFDGEIEVNGVQYNYVKKKLCNDTLYLLCITNEEKTKLLLAEHNYSALVNNASAAASGKKSNSVPGTFQKLFSAAYNQIHTEYILTAGFKSLAQKHFTVAMNLFDCFIPIPHQPPKALA